MPRLRFAGQITGCEGYIESAAIGLLTGMFAANERLGLPLSGPPATTAFGALLGHITGGHILDETPSLLDGDGDGDLQTPRPRSFQPMNVNFGLFPPMEPPSHDDEGKRIKGKDKTFWRKRAMSRRALTDLASWLGSDHAVPLTTLPTAHFTTGVSTAT